MKKLTLTFDSIDLYSLRNQKEFNDYILSLNGVLESNISCNDDGTVTFNITYDDNIIKDKILCIEIKTFLKQYRYPSLILFDKHFDGNIDKKTIKKTICCEFCFKITIEDLFDIDEIVKVENNYIERYIENYTSLDEGEDILTIYYDKDKFDSCKIDEIIKALNI